jgi:hypothetical protein
VVKIFYTIPLAHANVTIPVIWSIFYSNFYTHPAVSSQDHLHTLSLGRMSYQNQLTYGTQLRSVTQTHISSYLILLEHSAGAVFPSILKDCWNRMTASTTVTLQHTNHQSPLCLLFLSSTLHLTCTHSILLLKLLITAHITLFEVCTLISLAQFSHTQPNQQSKQNL